MDTDWIDPVRAYVAWQTQADKKVMTIKEPALRGAAPPEVKKPKRARRVRARSAAAAKVAPAGSPAEADIRMRFQRTDGKNVEVTIGFAMTQRDVERWIKAAQDNGTEVRWEET